MKMSETFVRTRREAPSDEVSKNAKLLIRAGYINKEMAGVYSLLPSGRLALEKINTIIRKEMHTLGAEEIFLSALQDKNVWEKTDRWSDKNVDVWFKTSLKNGGEMGLGFTHEEPLTTLMTNHIRSYKDLPRSVFQIQTKFRNETRAKSGIIRGREFLMKDLYSFSKDTTEHELFYEKAKVAYSRIFKSVGIGDKTYTTFATGGSFSKFSHEFQTVCDAGEDTIHICEKCSIAINDEVLKDQPTCPSCDGTSFTSKTAVEVGNIFSLGTRFSDALGLSYASEDGSKKSVVMGSYGIGPTRLLGVIAELCSDEKGLVLPESVAPYKVHLIGLDLDDASIKAQVDTLYSSLIDAGVSVLFDDRDLRAGEKFADADLTGLPIRITVGKKSVALGGVEYKARSSNDSKIVPMEQIVAEVK